MLFQAYDDDQSTTSTSTSTELILTTPTISKSQQKNTQAKTSTTTSKKLAMDAMNQALRKMNEPDDEFKVFGDFIASELRKVANKNDAYRLQRKMQRVLLDYMDEIDRQPYVQYVDEQGRPINITATQYINTPVLMNTPISIEDGTNIVGPANTITTDDLITIPNKS